MDVKKQCYLFFDFDGTITVAREVTMPDGTLKTKRIAPDENVQALRAVHEQGHKIFLCTGRSRGALLAMRDEHKKVFDLPWDGMICGASEMWYENSRLAISLIPQQECFAWLEYCIATSRTFCYNGSENVYRINCRKFVREKGREALYSFVTELLQTNPLTNLSTIPAADDGKAPKTALSVIHMPTYSDLFAPGCNKGNALLQFCKLIGAPIEQTIGFGDSENDVDMFRVCDQTVCMYNAPEVLRAHSDYKAKNKWGVAEGIRHYFGV